MTMPTTHISTTPYWATSATFPTFAKVAQDVETDVAALPEPRRNRFVP